MADKSIEQLAAANAVQSTDLFVLQQSGTAKKLTGQTLENWLLAMADGHGGIQSIEKVSTSGLVDTYRITLSDTTATTFTVTNGAKGDKGNQTYVHIRWSSVPNPTNADISAVPDAYIGIYAGTSASAPATAASYAPWYKYKGEKGDTGTPATMEYHVVDYKALSYGTGDPGADGWSESIPSVPQGSYLWTRSRIKFVGEEEQVSYSVAHAGRDGSGAVSTVNGIAPENGNVQLTAANVGALNKNDLLQFVYPVGSIYMSANNVSPASFLGGTWQQLENRFLLGAGSEYAAGETGGEKTHTLTTSEMPAHTHQVEYVVKQFGTGTSGVRNVQAGDNHVTSNSTGGGNAHNNMPPYLAVYMWQRTA